MSKAEYFPSKSLSPYIKEHVFHQRPGKVLVGTAVRWELGTPEKKYLAVQINEKLLNEGANMQVVSTEEIIASMNNGTTVLRVGDNNELLGFAQASADLHDPRRIVIGSWIGITHLLYTRGSGKTVMKHAAELALNSLALPNAREVIARVREDNMIPQWILQDLGAEFEATVNSPTTGNRVNVYNLTKVGLGRI